MRNLKLERRKDSIFATSESLPEAVEVVLVYARPISARERQVAVLSAKKRKEVAWIDSLAELDASSRAIAEEALYDRYRISIVESVWHLGNAWNSSSSKVPLQPLTARSGHLPLSLLKRRMLRLPRKETRGSRRSVREGLAHQLVLFAQVELTA